MKHMKIVKIPAKEEERVDYITCDLCGEKIKWNAGDPYDKLVIQKKTGSLWPEGGIGTLITFDLCEKCFDEKLIPWFKSQGAEPQETDWEV